MKRRLETFPDMLTRLFPEEFQNSEMVVGGKFVRNITFQVTEDCNMRCTYCYQEDKTPQVMSFETGKKFIDLLLQPNEATKHYIDSTNCPGCVIEFIGGEPFLEIDLIDQLTDYFLEKCIELNHPWATRYVISITSNGLLYFTEKVQSYLKKHFGKIFLSITIDGNKELHDTCRFDICGKPTYDRAIKAADHWGKTVGERYLTSKVTLSPYNIDKTSSALIDLIKHGYKTIYCNCVYEKGWEIKHARALYTHLKTVADYIIDNNLCDDINLTMFDNTIGDVWHLGERTWCGGTGLMICLAPDGNIYPCLRYAPSSVGHRDKLVVVGNVDDGIMATDEQIKTVQCMACVTRQSQCKGTECENCPIAAGCSDCAAYSWQETGTIGSRVTYHCDTHKARCLANSYYFNKREILRESNVRYKVNVPKEWALEIIDEEEYNTLIKMSEVK